MQCYWWQHNAGQTSMMSPIYQMLYCCHLIHSDCHFEWDHMMDLSSPLLYCCGNVTWVYLVGHCGASSPPPSELLSSDLVTSSLIRCRLITISHLIQMYFLYAIVKDLLKQESQPDPDIVNTLLHQRLTFAIVNSSILEISISWESILQFSTRQH